MSCINSHNESITPIECDNGGYAECFSYIPTSDEHKRAFLSGLNSIRNAVAGGRSNGILWNKTATRMRKLVSGYLDSVQTKR